ncbi:MAG: hypothetical protein HYY43_01500 [Deltaproteobacteria bacterium]|nr:hypothetical protein [Deltaproteobacteria bacterium]
MKGPDYKASSNDDASLGLAQFPHTETWADPEEHGADDLSTCSVAGCHGANLEGDSGPACNKCHQDYPHSTDWIKKEVHGKFVQENGNTRCATKCHGADFAGGLSGIACQKCHDTYPHKENFALPDVHGLPAAGDNKNVCALCHGSDWSGGDVGISCLNCHNQLYPHASGWSNKDAHGAWVVENSKIACETKCHGTDLKGGLSGISCENCHTVWPSDHKTENWKTAAHGLKFIGLGKSACLGCHGEDWMGGNTGSETCYKCHNSLPQHYDGSLWKETGHEKYAAALGGNFDECKKCHGANLEGKDFGELGIKNIPACSSCHESYPLEHAEANWPEKAGHALFTDSAAKLENCKLCHGSDFSGGSANVACTTCHVVIPEHVDADWKEKNHGKFVLTDDDKYDLFSSANYGDKCQFCHGEIYDLTNDWPSGAVITASGTKKCYYCHSAYPHYNYVDSDGLINPWSSDQVLGKWTHMIYLGWNAHFDDGDNDINDVINNCGGGTNGYCHNNTRQKKTYKIGKVDTTCNSLCHSKK